MLALDGYASTGWICCSITVPGQVNSIDLNKSGKSEVICFVSNIPNSLLYLVTSESKGRESKPSACLQLRAFKDHPRNFQENPNNGRTASLLNKHRQTGHLISLLLLLL